MEEVVKYQKQRSVFLVLNAQLVTTEVFFNLKKCVSWINGLEVRALEDPLVYSRVAYVIGKGRKFSFVVGGAPHYVAKMSVNGSFSVSAKRVRADGDGVSAQALDQGFVEGSDYKRLEGGSIVDVSEGYFLHTLRLDRSNAVIIGDCEFRAVWYGHKNTWTVYQHLNCMQHFKTEKQARRYIQSKKVGDLISSGRVG